VHQSLAGIAEVDAPTFSSILANAPPPPSPFPKTRRAVASDSRF